MHAHKFLSLRDGRVLILEVEPESAGHKISIMLSEQKIEMSNLDFLELLYDLTSLAEQSLKEEIRESKQRQVESEPVLKGLEL